MDTYQNITGMTPPETKYTEYSRNNSSKYREKPTYTLFQRKKFQILCIQTLFKCMKNTLDKILPFSATEQAHLLSCLYHFFEMNVKGMSFQRYLQFHDTLPNSSAEIIHVTYTDKEQIQPPEELLVLPSFEKFMENKNSTEEDSVRSPFT